MELEDGVFYQESYDGTEVAITAHYPGLFLASHITNQEIYLLKEPPHSVSPTALSCAPKGRRSARHATPEATPKRATPTPDKPSKRKANEDMTDPSSKRYGFVCPLVVTSNCDIICRVLSGKAFAGLCPGILPVAPPPVRFPTPL